MTCNNQPFDIHPQDSERKEEKKGKKMTKGGEGRGRRWSKSHSPKYIHVQYSLTKAEEFKASRTTTLTIALTKDLH